MKLRKGRKWHEKIPNLENLEFYTCTLWDHNAKFLIMVYRRNSWVPNDCILVGINETKWTTFDFMRNDVLQNYLVQFLKCLADNFDTWNFKMQAKLQFLDHQIVTSCIAIVNVVFLLFISKEMIWKILQEDWIGTQISATVHWVYSWIPQSM